MATNRNPSAWPADVPFVDAQVTAYDEFEVASAPTTGASLGANLPPKEICVTQTPAEKENGYG